MSHKLIQTAVVLGVFGLAAATLLVPMIDGTVEDNTDRVGLQQGQFEGLTDILNVTALDVRSNQGYADIRYRNDRTFERVDVRLNETDPPENKTIQLSGENITTSLIAIDDNETAVVETTYDTTFGWDSGPETFMNNFEAVLVIISALIVFGLPVVMLR